MSTAVSESPVLVIGGTGKQGGATARALLARGAPVRALVRDPAADRARDLERRGAALVLGDLNDPESLVAAATGARAVFSVQTPDPSDLASDSERVQGKNLVEAAQAAGVPHFVHTSVSGAGDYHRAAPGWTEGRWNEHCWESKAYTDELVRAAGFRHWTIIQPAFFMENFIRPSFLFRNWVEDEFRTVLRADTWLPLVAVDDIGTTAALAIADPQKFHGVTVDLAGDYLPMTEIARILSEAWAARIELPALSPAEALAQGLIPELVNGHEWMNEVGSPARPEHARALGIPTTLLRDWAARTGGPAS
ncbi:NmrA/HSCARG family protein [Dactylosporangium sp. CA-092794]|uniref:NmrA/HSCARG family protein n=1 Tax=Dactylosporangium sp. CA-092794 TaxID=3239929 RepID=UPI003D8F88F4